MSGARGGSSETERKRKAVDALRHLHEDVGQAQILQLTGGDVERDPLEVEPVDEAVHGIDGHNLFTKHLAVILEVLQRFLRIDHLVPVPQPSRDVALGMLTLAVLCAV